jgi:hypothetical protein
MTNDYFKVISAKTIRSVEVSIPPEEVEDDGELFKNIAAVGYIGTQSLFFFDDRNPDSIRIAFEEACTECASQGGKLSVYRRPKVAGPWDGLPYVGQMVGELS